MKNKLILITSTLFIAVMLVSLVSAFGVSSPYWEDNPLKMAKGETVVVNLNLQNMVGDNDVTVKAELVEGSDITSLEEDTFTVASKTYDTMVPLTVKMPSDVEDGDTQTVKVVFKTISQDTSGISMGTGMTVLFDVVAVEKTSESNTGTIIAVIVVILALAIIILCVKKKKEN
jgi:hypothetical protein